MPLRETVTVWPFSAPLVTTVTVPAELSSVALREVSQPAVTLEMVGAVVSRVTLLLEALERLPAASTA